MKRARHLFDRVAGFTELCAAVRRAAKGKHLSPEAAAFVFDREPEVLRLQRELLDGSYRPGPFRTFRIRDPKPRTISAAPFRDRVVHHALCAAIEPTLERYAIFHSYACRPGKGTLAAVHHTQHLARRCRWFAKLDVEKCFETIDHDVLRTALRRKLADRRVLDLIDVILGRGAPGSAPGRGLPIGNLTSQHFANFYLGAFDHRITEREHPVGYCRYMDDILLFAESQDRAWALVDASRCMMRDCLRLQLKDSVTLVQRTGEGVPFLGFRIWPGTIRLDAKRVRRFRKRFRSLRDALPRDACDEEACERVAASLVGWAEQACTLGLRRSFFCVASEGGMMMPGERRQRARTG